MANQQSGDPTPPIGTRLSLLARQDPDAPVITAEGVTITRDELDRSTNRLARAYAELGVRQGDYVTIMLPNGIEWVRAAVAAWKLGATIAPLSARMPEQEFAAMLELAPRALIAGRVVPGFTCVPAGFLPATSLSDEPLPPVVSPVWKAMPSGGSTGRPKMIAVTADSRIDPTGPAALFGLTVGGTQLVTGPLTHNTSVTTLVHGMLIGQHIVLTARFDAEQALRLIAEHHVEFIATVPAVLQRLLPVYRANPDAYDLSSLRRLWHLGSACPPELKQSWIEILGPDAVWEMYGGTESTAVTAIGGGEWLEHRGSVGRAVVGSIRVVDEIGEDCPPGVVGEIAMRPPAGVEATYRYIGSETVKRDGWDTLGDLGWFDEDGYLYISDRRVDMYNVGGRKVYPSEVESAIAAHPAVLSSVVVGVPDDELGQAGYALVEADAAAGLDEHALFGFLRERLAEYKLPRRIEFRAEPLRDVSGKVRRSAIRDEIVERLRAEASAAP
ncbi:AMP-dependent synthetase [Nonomuraea mesophila]|uniref:AMP-dependent synthetase n=2 Tax=Nonomuraea mesophila TaxID=2530382 RepID=A0A4R5F9V9_9ACTN|nr:AMP-dependent synthetase [Nonomuraea mesophila]